MRQAQKSNRARGRGSRKGGGGGGNNINRVYESAGPEGKVRGTPQQIMDKYLSLARDAQTSGDRVTAENFLQHAEHYQRILIQALGAQAERRDPSSQDQPEVEDQPERQAEEGAPEPAPSGEKRQRRQKPAVEEAAGGEVSGLTTIDSGPSNEPDLLVTTEDISSSQPRRRRGNGRAREDAQEGGAQAEAEQPETPQAE